MSNINKLDLLRSTIDTVMLSLTPEEKLCVLIDMVCPVKDEVRWNGINGEGSAVLEQGMYDSIIKFRRVAFLWKKVVSLAPQGEENREEYRNFVIGEAKRIKQLLITSLSSFKFTDGLGVSEPFTLRFPCDGTPEIGGVN
jgi:hypothetical protein